MSEGQKKIILVGDVGVGKTSLILKFTDNIFEENTTATVQFDFKAKAVPVVYYDTAGQERFGTITSSIYRKAKGVAYVYDVTREDTFANLKMWMEEVTRKYNDVQTTNTVIVGNKCDLPAKVPLDVVQKFAQENKAVFIQASSKTGEGVEEIFTTLAKGLDGDKGGSSTDVGPTRLRRDTSPNNNVIREKKKRGICDIL